MARYVNAEGLNREEIGVVETLIAMLKKTTPVGIIPPPAPDETPDEHTARYLYWAIRQMTPPPPPPPETPEEWVSRFNAYYETYVKHNYVVDDSRESIYEGCGE